MPSWANTLNLVLPFQSIGCEVIFQVVKFIARPLVIGVMSGTVGGILVVVLGRILSLDDTVRQEAWAFSVFVIIYTLFGICDSIKNVFAWLQYRESQAKRPTHTDSRD